MHFWHGCGEPGPARRYISILRGRFMASWFYASEGKQQGPFPEGQFRDLVAQGVVRPDTLVWTEGMAGWQKAAEIPGLIGGAPPAVPMGAPGIGQSRNSGGYAQAGHAGGGGALSVGGGGGGGGGRGGAGRGGGGRGGPGPGGGV